MNTENTFLDAIDVVCDECNYRSEDTCETCPVRKTWVDMLKRKAKDKEESV